MELTVITSVQQFLRCPFFKQIDGEEHPDYGVDASIPSSDMVAWYKADSSNTIRFVHAVDEGGTGWQPEIFVSRNPKVVFMNSSNDITVFRLAGEEITRIGSVGFGYHWTNPMEYKSGVDRSLSDDVSERGNYLSIPSPTDFVAMRTSDETLSKIPFRTNAGYGGSAYSLDERFVAVESGGSLGLYSIVGGTFKELPVVITGHESSGGGLVLDLTGQLVVWSGQVYSFDRSVPAVRRLGKTPLGRPLVRPDGGFVFVDGKRLKTIRRSPLEDIARTCLWFGEQGGFLKKIESSWVQVCK